MKIIDKYMVKGFLGPFIWCVFIFMVMAVIIDIFSFIDDIVKYKIPLASIASFYFYYLPTILIQVTPMAVLLSTIFILSTLNKNNEITAMKSSGISLWRIMAPILIIGIVVSMVIFIVNDKVIPKSSRMAGTIRREELEREKRKTNQAKVIQNVAVYGAGNRIVFARTYDTGNAVLGDIIMHEHDSMQNLTSKITAEGARWVDGQWKFSKVIIYRIDNAGRILGDPAFFDEKILPLKENPGDFANLEWSSDYLSYKDLKNYVRKFTGGGTKLMKGLIVDLYYKISFPLISFIIILIGAPFAIITTRGGVLIGIGMSIAIGLLYYASIAISIAFGKAGILPPFIAAWLANVIFAGLGVYLINKRT